MHKWFVVICLVWVASDTEARQGPACPTAPAPGAVCTVEGVEFVAIPGGAFAMGENGSDSGGEQPVHEVTLEPFWMARTELTLWQWNTFVTAAGYPRGRSQAESDDHPVVSITWEDAKAYCDWLSKTHGRIVRLPTEAEWEYAARGGLKGRRYPNGDTITTRDANYASGAAVKVGTYPANGYGLHDMAGNVFEWVADWYDPGYYRVSPRSNPRGPATREDALQRRADRGGGWCMGEERTRVAARHAGPGSWDQSGTADCLGFRPVMEMSRAP